MKKKIKKQKVKAAWDECVCLKCGNTWNASVTEQFNFTFCYNCHSSKIGGEYWKKEK